MNRTIDGQWVPYPIVESIYFRGKPRTIVEVEITRKCGCVRGAMVNLNNAAKMHGTRDNSMSCPDCFAKGIR